MKYLVITFTIIIIFLLSILIFVPAKKSVPETSISGENTKSAKDLATEKAIALYQEKKNEGMKFETGPCLSEEIIPDWVVDIAHNPRQEVDNQPENQCQSYRAGKTHHFVELDPEGNLIRAL